MKIKEEEKMAKNRNQQKTKEKVKNTKLDRRSVVYKGHQPTNVIRNPKPPPKKI